MSTCIVSIVAILCFLQKIYIFLSLCPLEGAKYLALQERCSVRSWVTLSLQQVFSPWETSPRPTELLSRRSVCVLWETEINSRVNFGSQVERRQPVSSYEGYRASEQAFSECLTRENGTRWGIEVRFGKGVGAGQRLPWIHYLSKVSLTGSLNIEKLAQ